jgi:hypothetical protein
MGWLLNKVSGLPKEDSFSQYRSFSYILEMKTSAQDTLASWGLKPKGYKIDKDGFVDILTDLDLRGHCKDSVSLPTWLRSVNGYLYLAGCTSLTSLGELRSVGRYLYLLGCTSLTSLGGLKTVKDWLDLSGCTSLTSLGGLRSVNGRMSLSGCTSLTSLGELRSVEGYLSLQGCISLISLGGLRSVEGDLYDVDGTEMSWEVVLAQIESLRDRLASDPEGAPREHFKAKHFWEKEICNNLLLKEV